MSGHTPGPWSVVDGFYPSFREIKGPSFTISIVMSATDLNFSDCLKREADANLIASAPDLLAERDRLKALNAELADALEDLTDIIENAGLLNLVNGVQLGQTSWYVKASDRMDTARAALAKQKESS